MERVKYIFDMKVKQTYLEADNRGYQGFSKKKSVSKRTPQYRRFVLLKQAGDPKTLKDYGIVGELGGVSY